MHYVHKILIKTDSKDKDEIRDQAVEETEQFWNTVYDWRETDTAGRWSDEYPDNVILGSENLDALIKAIENSKQSQDAEKEWYYRNLKSTDLKDIEKSEDHMDKFYLLQLAKLIYGEYDSDSYFYNCYEGSSTIDDNLFQWIRDNADSVALVIMDIHN